MPTTLLISITPATLSISAVIAMVLLAFTQGIANKFTSKIRSQAKKVKIFNLNSLLYILACLLILAIPTLFVFIIQDLVTLFIILTIYSGGMGAIHCHTFYKRVKWAEKSVDLLPDLLFTLVITILATVTLLALLSLISTIETNNYFSPSDITVFRYAFLPFLIGMFIFKTIFLLQEVPQLEYPTFKISNGDKSVSPEERRNSRPIGITLHFPISTTDENTTKIDCKLFSDVEFGTNIYQLIRQYNGRADFPNIETHNQNGNEYEYLFYFKPTLLGRKKFIDPEINVVKNKISNKDTIIAQRKNPQDQ